MSERDDERPGGRPQDRATSPNADDRAAAKARRRAERRRLVRRRRAVLALVVIVILLIVTIVVITRGCGGDAAETAASPSPSTSAYAPDDRWWPLIQEAAEEHGIDPVGLHKMMLAESDGRPDLVSDGQFYGLYQYVQDTWSGDWNPWREQDIFHGPSQIKATALAIKNGKGPYWWPNTYGPAFGEE